MSSKSFNRHEFQLLNKNLNFCPTPQSFNKNVLNNELNAFYRRIKLKAFFKDAKSTATKEELLFKKKSTWTPTKNHHSVDTFIDLVNNDIKQLNSKQDIHNNLSPKEKEALKNLHNRTDIIITKADKGGAVVIMDTETYIAEAERQLNDTFYYKRLPHDVTDLHEEKVRQTLSNLKSTCNLENKIAEGLMPSDSKTPNFYLLPKIHKDQRPPPGRPVVNSINSPTSNISKYVDHKLQPVVTKLPSYVKDTTDFIKKLETIKTAPDNCYLITMDVKSLYTNIPHNEGINSVKTFMERHQIPIPTVKIVTTLLTLILTLNNFVFNGIHYLQKLGCAMGTKCAPNYANIFMGDFEEKYIYPFIEHYSSLYLRYIDDIFIIWKGTKGEFEKFIKDLNSKHATIKFEYEISKKEINFLDTTVFISTNNVIKTRLYKKKTDIHNYLHRRSAHPEKLKKTIPYGQALRVRRICTENEDLHRNCIEMKEDFIRRGYHEREVVTQIQKAKELPRETALTSKPKQPLSRIPLVLTFNPTLPPIMDVIKKHWNVLQSNPNLREIFNEPPMTAYRRNVSIGDLLNSHTLNQNQVVRKNRRKKEGKCQPCLSRRNNLCCKLLKSCTSFRSHQTKKVYRIFHTLNCKSTWVLYLMECRLCPVIQYVGKSEPPANIRFNKHRDDCKVATSIEIDQHFRLPGHNFNEHATFTYRTTQRMQQNQIRTQRNIRNKRRLLDDGA